MPPAPLDPLSRLALRHGTDKFGQHLYTPIYHRLFGPLREEPIRLLELGVGWPRVSTLGGASLCMWRDYFANAALVGLDLQPKRLDLGPRVTVLQGSQSDPELLRRVWAVHGPFDIVVDDGSHVAGDVLASFETLFPMLPEGGYYAVEDVQTAFWPEFGGQPSGEGTIIARLHALVLAMHAPEQRAAGQAPAHEAFGDLTASVQVHRNLIVFERGANAYPSNRGLPINDPQVQEVLARMDAERVRDPSAGEAMTRAGMLEVAGHLQDALEVVRRAAQAHPDSLALACLAQHLTWQLGLREESRAWLAELLRAVPDEPAFRMMAAHMPLGG